MISLCLRCHAKVGRTKCVLSEMPPLLLQLWREQHPDGHEQVMIDFTVREMPAEPMALFPEEKRAWAIWSFGTNPLYIRLIIRLKLFIMSSIQFRFISPFLRLLLGMGGERSSTPRMRLAGKICCFCGRYLDATLWQLPGERACDSCAAQRAPAPKFRRIHISFVLRE
jgi:hypothetical protein